MHIHNDYMDVYDFCFMFLMFIDYYENIMIIRPLTYMYSFWRSPMFIWTHMLCSHHCLAIVYIIVQIKCGLT